ncbi:7009_t:CDS:2 [Cetraspora pellucida]|uniref:7009_t:CDS:1 n=1 Tax=Cetraspora pellucida TaxID=1433469 RepID=A0A9N9NFW0_9GLOM|nr:7009_t:CDS:2 [Cetraspora pellucida]
MLKNFPVSQFISDIWGQDIEQLWYEFYQLYSILQQPQLSDQVYQYKVDAENWADVMPYMYVFAKHVPIFMQQLKAKGLSLQIFSISAIKKKNHKQIRLFFGDTTMEGGSKKMSVVYDMMSYENKQFFYLINNISTEITIQNIHIYNKENLLN